MRRAMWVTVAVIASAMLPVRLAAQTPVDRTVATSATGKVSIHNVAGEVRVIGWDRSEVRVTGTLGRGTERLEVQENGNDLRVRVVIPRNARDVGATELEVRVPVRKDVELRGTSADLAIQGVTGMVDLNSTSGSVEVSGSPSSVKAVSTSGNVSVDVNSSRVEANSTSGQVRVQGQIRETIAAGTVSGSVDVAGSSSEVIAKSVSGRIRVAAATRRLSAGTVSGNIEVGGGPLQYAALETVSGEVAFAGDLQVDAAVNVQSHSGSVVLSLPRNLSAKFQAATFSGGIESDFGGAAERTSDHGPGRKLEFVSGNGNALVTVKSFSGNVEFRRRN